MCCGRKKGQSCEAAAMWWSGFVFSFSAPIILHQLLYIIWRRCPAAADQAATAAPAASAARCTLTLRRRAPAALRPPSSSAWPRRRRPGSSRRRRSPARPPTAAAAVATASATPAPADCFAYTPACMLATTHQLLVCDFLEWWLIEQQ
jgi:hypothetical protein